jgi:hypothetical protein
MRCFVCQRPTDPASPDVHPCCAPPAEGNLADAVVVLLAAGMVSVDSLQEQGVLP